MFNKNKSKGQTSIEILAILGVLVIGGIILGTFYLSNINKKTAEATEIANLDYNGLIGDLNEPIYGSPCGNGVLDAGERCDGALFGPYTCATEGYNGGGTLSCNSNCTLNTSNCLGTFEITATHGNNGSIDPEGTATYNANSTPSFLITADSGYEINTIILDGTTGVSVIGTTYTYIFDPLASDHTIHATFKLVGTPTNTYKIVSTAGPNCTINPLGTTDVNEGNNQSYKIVPDTGYEIDTLVVDLLEVIPTLDYEFINVQANHTIDVTCRIKDPTPPADYTIFAFVRTIPSDGTVGGTIIPSGQVLVPAGNDQTFTWSANPGYLVGEVNIDGTVQSFGHLGNSYTFYAVDRNHAIRITFVKNVGVSYTLTYTAGQNGTISGTSPQTVAKGGSGTPVTAIGNTGYDFNQWSDGSIQNPRTDTNVQGNITVAALFAPSAGTQMKINVTPTPPTIGSATVNTNFNVDVNTLENASTVRYTLKVDFKDNVTGVLTSNCSYNGVYAPSITLGTNLAPSALSYTPFSCNIIGTYRLTFTATNDSNAANSAYKDSTWTINVLSTVAKPTASPVGDRYSNDQSVTLSCSTPSAIIHYTLNGSAPDCSSTQYVSAIPITGNKTIRAIGCLAGWNPSPIMTEEYMLKVAKPTANPVGGPVNPNTTVSLSSTTIGAEIHYTTNGSKPICSSPLYTSPITITTDTLLKAVGCKTEYTSSSIMQEQYTIFINYCGILADQAIYTVVYPPQTCGPLDASSPKDIKHMTCTNNLSTLNTVTYENVWVGLASSYNLSNDFLANTGSVGQLFCERHGLFFAAGTINQTIKSAKGVKGDCSGGDQFVLDSGPPGVSPTFATIICETPSSPKVATPVASIGLDSVTLTTSTPGASICYTTDGTNPTTFGYGQTLMCGGTSVEYTAPLWIPLEGLNIKAIGIMTPYFDPTSVMVVNGWVTSNMLTYSTIVATPVATPGNGSQPNPQYVSLSTTTPGATIKYTLDGTNLSCASGGTVYSNTPITIPVQPTTLKAIACKTYMDDSNVLTATYNFCNDPNVTLYNYAGPPCSAPLAAVLESDTCAYNFSNTNYVTYTGITLSGAGGLPAHHIRSTPDSGILFCLDHKLVYDQGISCSNPGSIWDETTACGSIAPHVWIRNGNGSWAGNYCTAIVCRLP